MSSQPSSSSRIFSVIGFWHRSSPSATDVDVEAQMLTGTHTSFPSPPQPAYTRSASRPVAPPSNEQGTDPIDDFFGVTRTPCATHESRHDRAQSATVGAPPPYQDGELPVYSTHPQEPPTLAKYLFRFGFIFPLFWIAGALILISPLRAPADWHPSKPEEERQAIVHSMRAAEIKWAKRCVLAVVALILVVIVVVLVSFAVLKWT